MLTRIRSRTHAHMHKRTYAHTRTHAHMQTYTHTHDILDGEQTPRRILNYTAFFDGYCSTVQGLLDWFEVDLGFTELSFIQIDLCVLDGEQTPRRILNYTAFLQLETPRIANSRLWHAAELGEVCRMCIYIYMCISRCVHVCTLASGTPLSWARYVVCVSIYICVYLGVYMYVLSPLACR